MCGEKSKNEQRVEGFRVQLKHASLVSVLCIFYFLFTYDGVGSGFLLATSTDDFHRNESTELLTHVGFHWEQNLMTFSKLRSSNLPQHLNHIIDLLSVSVDVI
jgi:hypothetical protein